MSIETLQVTQEIQTALQPVLNALALALVAWFIKVVSDHAPAAIEAFERRTGVQVTAQNYQAMVGAIKTAAGIIETKIDQGQMTTAHVVADNSDVATQARAAIDAVPGAAAAFNMTEAKAARMIVGAVDTQYRAPFPDGQPVLVGSSHDPQMVNPSAPTPPITTGAAA